MRFMAGVAALLLLPAALGATWLAHALTVTSLPSSDIYWTSAISVLLWAGFAFCLNRAFTPR